MQSRLKCIFRYPNILSLACLIKKKGPFDITCITTPCVHLLIIPIELDSLAGSESCLKDDQPVHQPTSLHLHVAPSDLSKVLRKESPATRSCVVQPLVNYARCNPGTAVENEGHHGGTGAAGIELLQASQREAELRGEAIGDLQLQNVVFVEEECVAF